MSAFYSQRGGWLMCEGGHNHGILRYMYNIICCSSSFQSFDAIIFVSQATDQPTSQPTPIMNPVMNPLQPTPDTQPRPHAPPISQPSGGQTSSSMVRRKVRLTLLIWCLIIRIAPWYGAVSYQVVNMKKKLLWACIGMFCMVVRLI